jgi:hypothetical protein
LSTSATDDDDLEAMAAGLGVDLNSPDDLDVPLDL